MSNIIKVNFKDGEVKNISKDTNIGYYDLKNQIEELFKFKTNYKQNQIIMLSMFCDCMYNLKFLGINKDKEILFQVC